MTQDKWFLVNYSYDFLLARRKWKTKNNLIMKIDGTSENDVITTLNSIIGGLHKKHHLTVHSIVEAK